MDVQAFRSPGKAYRPAPFWSWNDQLTPDRLEKQATAFAQAGMGGFFMHARPGIRTPFLEDEWFQAVTASIESAKQHSMQAWLYDECSYPSGFAAGLVPKHRPDLAQKGLCCRVLSQAEVAERTRPQANELALFVIDSQGYRRLDMVDGQETGDAVYLQFVVEQHQGTAWLNGYPYVDLLHEDTAHEFLAAAYEPYVERYAEYFGNVIPGVFTDEPNIAPPVAGAVPWTPALPIDYSNRYNEDLLECLPELFLEVGQYSKTRHRFWRLVTERFIANWMRPIYEWCEQHNLKFTGHLWEHVLSPMYSGSLMAPLEYMHIPGMDLLGVDSVKARTSSEAGLPAQMGNIHMAKVVTSVAHQLGRERVLSETYGGCGWEITFENQKRYAEWEYALGVNLLNQHLSHYSLRGYRKFDYPISFQNYQPWWPWYRVLGDYFGRLSYALSQGKYQAELLVLHPMASLWASSRPSMPATVPGASDGPGEQRKIISATLDRLTKTLTAANWGYDFGDDLLIERHGCVIRSGEHSKPYLQIGAMQYQAVVLPACTNLTTATYRLLMDFAMAGGLVWILLPMPAQVDGCQSDLSALFEKAMAIDSPEMLVTQLSASVDAGNLAKKVNTTTSTLGAPIFHIVKETDDGDAVFLANMGETAHLGEKVWLRGCGQVERWDLVNGDVEVLPATQRNGGLEVVLDFAETESHLLFVRPDREASLGQVSSVQSSDINPNVASEALADFSEPRIQVARPQALGRHLPVQVEDQRSLADTWQFQRLDPNVLVLDQCIYKIGDGPWSEVVNTQEVAFGLRKHYDLMVQPFRDVQPWLKYPNGAPEFPETVTIRYRVQSDFQPKTQLYLVVEDAASFRISVNGQSVKPAQVEPLQVKDTCWLDPAFRKIPVGRCWHQGENIVELQFHFHADLPVESAFLLGDFAVSMSGTSGLSLVRESSMIKGGSWVEQGYPFYVGRAAFRQDVTLTEADLRQAVWLDCNELPNIAEVHCNGKNVGLLSWRPYRVELTPWLQAGKNTLEIVVANSLHNAFGPMHTASLPVIIGPPQYIYNQAWVREYRLVPDGLPSQVRLLFA